MTRYKDTGTIRASSELTNSYVAGTVIDITSFEQLTLLISYIRGSGETGVSLIFKVEYSMDNITFYQETYDDNTADVTNGSTTTRNFATLEHQYGSTTVTGDNIIFELPTNARYLKISFKEDGVSLNYGTCSCDYTVKWTE